MYIGRERERERVSVGGKEREGGRRRGKEKETHIPSSQSRALQSRGNDPLISRSSYNRKKYIVKLEC